jgi:hypothetical protein
MVLEATPLSVGVEIETTPVTVAARCLRGYKYLPRFALGTICFLLPFSFLCLEFPSLALNSLVMGDKRGTKRSRSPSAEGSLSPSDAKTPPALSRSPPPPRLPSEVSSHRPHSSVFEQAGPSRQIPMVDLSSSSDFE